MASVARPQAVISALQAPGSLEAGLGVRTVTERREEDEAQRRRRRQRDGGE